MTRLRHWWTHRTLATRITLVVGGVALVALLALTRATTGLVLSTLVGATDTDLRARAETAAVRVRTEPVGALPVVGAPGPDIRVVDTAGTPVDGRPRPLDESDVRTLAAGSPVTVFGDGRARRWVAVPVTAPDGTPRLVLAASDLVGPAALLPRLGLLSVLGALTVTALVAASTWFATRAALAPVDRMRRAAAALPRGERLPVPPAPDPLRALAEEINGLLARRDDAAARLERFTGDAAHELRSPVASIRAQAEVAVAHPDPELAGETLRAVAVEAERMSVLIADLLALARADGGARDEPEPVELGAAARAALQRSRAGDLTAGAPVGDSPASDPLSGDLAERPDGPVVQLVASVAVRASARPREVGLVLDNLLANAHRHARSVVRIAVLPGGRWARLIVDDDGPGIPADERERVFDRFTRLTPTVDDEACAGLGLALVAALVAGRGGTVRAGDAPGGGARLEVRWPSA